jgi:hypothetical protein
MCARSNVVTHVSFPCARRWRIAIGRSMRFPMAILDYNNSAAKAHPAPLFTNLERARKVKVSWNTEDVSPICVLPAEGYKNPNRLTIERAALHNAWGYIESRCDTRIREHRVHSLLNKLVAWNYIAPRGERSYATNKYFGKVRANTSGAVCNLHLATACQCISGNRGARPDATLPTIWRTGLRISS